MFSALYNRVISLFKPTVPTSFVRKHAGQWAEDEVQRVLQQISDKTIRGAALIHNGLFVFHRDTDREFSIEIDHIFITPKNIYLVETKFKSGVIYAPPRKPFWKVINKGGYTPVRNCLKQILNSSLAIQRCVPLPVNVIPLVVMVGPNLRLHGNNHQVLLLDELKTTIARIESETLRDKAIVPRKIVSTFADSLSANPDDILKHYARVAQARNRSSKQLAKHLHRDEPFVIH